MHAARGIGDERPAVEDQLVVAADLVHERDRHAVTRGEPRDHAAPLARLVGVPRRARGIEDQVGARRGELADRIQFVLLRFDPGVLAHGQAERDLRGKLNRRARRRRREPAPLVEHVVGGQMGLRAHGFAASAAQQHAGVVERAALTLDRHDRADRDRHVARCRGERVELAQLIAHEAVALEQVHRRIPREHHLGGEQQVRALACRLRRGLLDQAAVAGEIPHGRIQLGERDPHGYAK